MTIPVMVRPLKEAAQKSNSSSKSWDHRFTTESSNRTTSTLEGTASFLKPGVIPLCTGNPDPAFFPWSTTTFRGLGSPPGLGNSFGNGNTAASHQDEHQGYETAISLGYGRSAGAPQLTRFFSNLVREIHKPPYADWECSLTCGTTSAMDQILRMFCRRGEYILTEEFTYYGMIEAATPLGIRIQGVKMDKEGLLPESLDSILSQWDTEVSGPRPFLLYTVPSGHNPTGATQSPERREAIYRVAEKYDLYIVEDDPYSALQLGPYTSSTLKEHPQYQEITRQDYLKSLVPSYLSFDTSGRVLRLDSLSKTLAPGFRVGWVTGCSQVIQRLVLHTEVSTVAPSGISQLIIYKLLVQEWGQEGFIDWLSSLAQRYRERRDAMLNACEKYLPATLCRWSIPSCGMFVWVSVGKDQYLKMKGASSFAQEALRAEKVSSTPYPDSLSVEDEIFKLAAESGVLIAKGSWFWAAQDSYEDINFRLTFTAAGPQELEEGVRRFGETLKGRSL